MFSRNSALHRWGTLWVSVNSNLQHLYKEQTRFPGGVSHKPGGLTRETWDACDQTTILPPLGSPVGKGWTGGIINTGKERQTSCFWVGEAEGRKWPGGSDLLLCTRRSMFLHGYHRLQRSRWACRDLPRGEPWGWNTDCKNEQSFTIFLSSCLSPSQLPWMRAAMRCH